VTTLSFVSASGNSSVDTLGFSNDYMRKWGLDALVLKCGAVRAEATMSTFAATGDSLEDAEVTEERATAVTAENYFLNGRFDYRLKNNDRWYWYGGAHWERNAPVGLEGRSSATAGVGRIVADSDRTKWRIDAGVGATREDLAVKPADHIREFGTFNMTSELKQKLGGGAGYSADFSSAYGVNRSSGWLMVLKQGLTVAVSRVAALKVGYDMSYRTVPTLISVPAHTSADPPEPLGEVLLPAKKLDTVATTSLVITF
jgi:putative salt-induced outer membrane protein YdiY